MSTFDLARPLHPSDYRYYESHNSSDGGYMTLIFKEGLFDNLVNVEAFSDAGIYRFEDVLEKTRIG